MGYVQYCSPGTILDCFIATSYGNNFALAMGVYVICMYPDVLCCAWDIRGNLGHQCEYGTRHGNTGHSSQLALQPTQTSSY